jgi:hypothetical protein
VCFCVWVFSVKRHNVYSSADGHLVCLNLGVLKIKFRPDLWLMSVTPAT